MTTAVTIQGGKSSTTFKMIKLPDPVTCPESAAGPAVWVDRLDPSNWDVTGSAVWTGTTFELTYGEFLTLIPHASWYNPAKMYLWRLLTNTDMPYFSIKSPGITTYPPIAYGSSTWQRDFLSLPKSLPLGFDQITILPQNSITVQIISLDLMEITV